MVDFPASQFVFFWGVTFQKPRLFGQLAIPATSACHPTHWGPGFPAPSPHLSGKRKVRSAWSSNDLRPRFRRWWNRSRNSTVFFKGKNRFHQHHCSIIIQIPPNIWCLKPPKKASLRRCFLGFKQLFKKVVGRLDLTLVEVNKCNNFERLNKSEVLSHDMFDFLYEPFLHTWIFQESRNEERVSLLSSVSHG